MTQDELFKVLVAHCKEYGFIFPSSEIYDGLAAVYDYGQMGVELKNNIKQYWWNAMTRLNENIVGIDSCIFMHPRIWEASGHVGAFNDPLIDNKDSKKRYRADVLIEDYLGKIEEKMNKEVAKSRKAARNSEMHSMRSSSVPQTLTSSAKRQNMTRYTTVLSRPSRRATLKNIVRSYWTAISYALSAAPATGRRSVSSTLCSALPWEVLQTERIRFICVLRPPRVFS